MHASIENTRLSISSQSIDVFYMQEFLAVFEQLRDEIVVDDLLAGQPESSKQWITEVSFTCCTTKTVDVRSEP